MPSLDDVSIKLFKDNWREYFQDNDERYCEIFQKLNSGISSEGSEIYLPLFLNSTSDFFDLFNHYSFLQIADELLDTVNDYQSVIDQRYEA